MGTICGSNESSRRSPQQSARETVRSTKLSHRRKVLHIGNDGICVRRYSPILLQQNEGASPTKTGIALRLSEWAALKEFIPQLHQKDPVLSTTHICINSTIRTSKERYRVWNVIPFYTTNCYILWDNNCTALPARIEKRTVDANNCR